MKPDGNSLDLNNLPEEHGKQPLEESSMTTAASADTKNRRFAGLKKKKCEGKDESVKVYECRFCSLKFCKSQALGGHMNRHRQERETETLNRARQLVFSNEGLAGTSAIGSQIALGGFQHGGGSIGDPCLSFLPAYPRIPTPPSNPSTKQPYIYRSSASPSLHFSPSYLPSDRHACNYYAGHTVSGSCSQRPPHHPNYNQDSSFINCFGAPRTRNFPMEGRDAAAPRNTSEEKSWCCSYGHVHHMDSSPSVDLFRDNFHG